MMTVAQAELDQWQEIRTKGFMSRVGALQASRTPAGWAYGLRVDDSHLNPVGVVHGGVLTTLIDHAIALFAWEAVGRRPVVTVQCDTRFLAPARSGDFIQVTSTLRHQSKSLIYIDADVTVSGRAVATGSAILKIARQTPEGSHDK